MALDCLDSMLVVSKLRRVCGVESVVVVLLVKGMVSDHLSGSNMQGRNVVKKRNCCLNDRISERMAMEEDSR